MSMPMLDVQAHRVKVLEGHGSAEEASHTYSLALRRNNDWRGLAKGYPSILGKVQISWDGPSGKARGKWDW